LRLNISHDYSFLPWSGLYDSVDSLSRNGREILLPARTGKRSGFRGPGRVVLHALRQSLLEELAEETASEKSLGPRSRFGGLTT